MEILSHNPTPLEQLINHGYEEISRTADGEWITLECRNNGLIYDIKRDVVIYRYKVEEWK